MSPTPSQFRKGAVRLSLVELFCSVWFLASAVVADPFLATGAPPQQQQHQQQQQQQQLPQNQRQLQQPQQLQQHVATQGRRLEIPVVANSSDVCSRTNCSDYARGKMPFIDNCTQKPCLTDEEARQCCEEEIKTFANHLTLGQIALIVICIVVAFFCFTSLLCCLFRRILCCCK
mmetsp:Transcript_174393/g.553576  ORF Transcript_174393/g.553576 Transcript_174393/m.553576 type:complete len:174 (+) Transcript_174393:73-594(+)